MKLFLASAFNKVAPKLLPLLPADPEDLIAGFIPNAADPYHTRPWVEVDRKALIELGFRVINIDLKRMDAKSLKDALSNIDVLFVAGGSTLYLLHMMRNSGLDKILKKLIEDGMIYVGSSAGSMVVGPTLEPFVNDEDEVEFKNLLTNYKGLGLTEKIILPHYNSQLKARLEAIIEANKSKNYKFHKLTDDEALIIQ